MKNGYEKLLPISVKILAEQITEAGEKAIESKQGGMEDAGGDAYHDEAFSLAENQFHLHTIRKSQMIESLGAGEIMRRPLQFETVEVGHAIRIRFLNDPFIDKRQTVTLHLVSPGDKKALTSYADKNPIFKSEFNDGESSLIVSTASSLGQSLLGKSKGIRGVYGGLDEIGQPFEYRFQIEDQDDALIVSPLFDLES